MSNNFTNNPNNVTILNYRDMDEFVHELATEIIKQGNLPAPPPKLPTYYQDMAKGIVIDDWGSDLYSNNNLQEQNNLNDYEYFVTYRRNTNTSNQVNGCNYTITYDFSILLSDCNPNELGTSKQRITRITDLFIESIVNNNLYYIADVQTAINATGNLTETNRYATTLNSAVLNSRIDFDSPEELNNKNYFTSNFQIKFFIQKII